MLAQQKDGNNNKDIKDKQNEKEKEKPPTEKKLSAPTGASRADCNLDSLRGMKARKNAGNGSGNNGNLPPSSPAPGTVTQDDHDDSDMGIHSDINHNGSEFYGDNHHLDSGMDGIAGGNHELDDGSGMIIDDGGISGHANHKEGMIEHSEEILDYGS